MSFAQELQTIYQAKKAELMEKKDENLERRAKDITVFFQSEIKNHAKERMRVRAEQGRPTANILEYQYNERFFVNDDQAIVRYVAQEVNYPNYLIHDVVMRDRVFGDLLSDFEKDISTSENPIQVIKWRPRDSLHVIETVWGKNRYHNPIRSSHHVLDEEAPFIFKGGRGSGRGSGRGYRGGMSGDMGTVRGRGFRGGMGGGRGRVASRGYEFEGGTI